MANRYGEAALMAVRMETYGKYVTPLKRWQEAIEKLYPTSPRAQRKSAPRLAFLGLCEAGLVKGIPAEEHAAENKDKTWALRAVDLLNAGTHRTISTIWSEVTGGEDIEHTGQMDVVLALWKNGFIVTQPVSPQ